MAHVNVGRMTHHYNGELVVFLIGMRLNQPWRITKWLPHSWRCRRCSPNCRLIPIPV